MGDIVERRVPVDMYLYNLDDHKPLDEEGLEWLANQLCSKDRVHPERTMATGWITTQAAFELPHLVDENEALRARVKELEGALGKAADDFEFLMQKRKAERCRKIAKQALKGDKQ